MSEACPDCGGKQRTELAPGYFACTSSKLVNVIPAGAQGNVADVPLYGPCGHRYQAAPRDPTTTPRCACGMYAVGECVECRTPLCGRHVREHHGLVLCSTHQAATLTAERERAAAAEREREAAEQQRRKRWIAETRSQLVRETPDPVAQLVRVLALTARRHQDYEEPVTATADWATLQALLPDMPLRSEHDLVIAPPWDHDQVHRWFLDNVTAAADRVLVRASLFGWTRERVLAGWRFNGGASGPPRNLGWHSARVRESVSILADGRRVDGRGYASDIVGFNTLALIEMAPLCSLPPLRPYSSSLPFPP